MDVIQWLWKNLYYAIPVVLGLQVLAAMIVLWRVAWRWQADTLGVKQFERWILYAGVFLAPPFMLFISAAMSAGYQGERGGHWFFHLHSEWAGLVLLPVFALGSLGLAVSFTRRQLQSGTYFVVLMTLLATCVWYAYATYFLKMGDDKTFDLDFTAIVPALAALNYALVGVDIYRHGKINRPNMLAVYVWVTAYIVSLAGKIPLAKKFYAALPPEMPVGYGDCFVVSAAALGHPAFVGSHFDVKSNRRVNYQLVTLQVFECRLARQWPSLHSYLRQVYNWLGPRIASRIRTQIAADITFVLLKPAEWLASTYLVVERKYSKF